MPVALATRGSGDVDAGCPTSGLAARGAEPEQTRDQLGIKRAVTGIQRVEAQ